MKNEKKMQEIQKLHKKNKEGISYIEKTGLFGKLKENKNVKLIFKDSEDKIKERNK